MSTSATCFEWWLCWGCFGTHLRSRRLCRVAQFSVLSRCSGNIQTVTDDCSHTRCTATIPTQLLHPHSYPHGYDTRSRLHSHDCRLTNGIHGSCVLRRRLEVFRALPHSGVLSPAHCLTPLTGSLSHSVTGSLCHWPTLSLAACCTLAHSIIAPICCAY